MSRSWQSLGGVAWFSGQGDGLIPQPSLTLQALRQAVAAVAPDRLPEMFAKMEEAFVQAGERGSVTPIDMFYREWAVIVEIERHPEAALRLHAAEQALMSDDPRSGMPLSLTQEKSCVPHTAQWLVSDRPTRGTARSVG